MDQFTRALVRSRAGNVCEYCRLPQAWAPLARHQIEHVRARQHGGTDEPTNLALACVRCNLNKGPNLSGVDPATSAVTLLFHPRTDEWAEHFQWEKAEVRGVTPAGRATVVTLKLNEERRLEVRRAHGAGE